MNTLFPQGLKPTFPLRSYGTTEVVPFHGATPMKRLFMYSAQACNAGLLSGTSAVSTYCAESEIRSRQPQIPIRLRLLRNLRSGQAFDCGRRKKRGDLHSG
jgi:hypothetical protein